jgi:hypothetical protein
MISGEAGWENMAKLGPTAKQVEYIEKLINEETGRNEVMISFLNAQNVSDVSDLSVRSASELIDLLRGKKMEGSSGNERTTRPATPKQISYIENLQRSEESRLHVQDFLKKVRKKSLIEIDSNEASDLIDYLKPISGSGRQDNVTVPATEKQLKFIRNLQKALPAKDQIESILKKLKKKSIEELTVTEASDMITRLKSGN